MYQEEKTIKKAALKAGINEKTAAKYIKSGKLPSELKKEHNWKTRVNPFKSDWSLVKELLENNPGLEAKTIFEELQRLKPGEYSDGQLRTLQRKIKVWKAAEGPPKEVFFSQVHIPGELCQSDFTDMSDIGITIQGKNFEHLLFHFVLTYSNWESGTICFSESFESLSLGLQNALWELGGIPKYHQTDRLSAAVNNLDVKKDFTEKYKSLMRSLRMQGKKTNPRSPHENGDIEQRHHRFKNALRQRLMLRGSKEFVSRDDYEIFIKSLMKELNSNRQDKLNNELKKLRELPLKKLEACTQTNWKVGKNSTVTAAKKVYSVNSSLRGETVILKIYPETVEVWYAGKCMEKIPRIRGKRKHKINYRHIIDSLVRKPGAFQNYKYKDDLFPTIYFRLAYDRLQSEYGGQKADKEYVNLLYLAATVSQDRVENILIQYIDNNNLLSAKLIEKALEEEVQEKSVFDVHIDEPDLAEFDILLDSMGVVQNG